MQRKCCLYAADDKGMKRRRLRDEANTKKEYADNEVVFIVRQKFKALCCQALANRFILHDAV